MADASIAHCNKLCACILEGIQDTSMGVMLNMCILHVISAWLFCAIKLFGKEELHGFNILNMKARSPSLSSLK